MKGVYQVHVGIWDVILQAAARTTQTLKCVRKVMECDSEEDKKLDWLLSARRVSPPACCLSTTACKGPGTEACRGEQSDAAGKTKC